MDLDEIIKPYSLAPDAGKRPASESQQAAGVKRHHADNGALAAGEVNGVEGTKGKKIILEELPDEVDASTVEKILEQADEVHIEEITEASIRRCAAQLERRLKKNQHDRIKFASNPEKWIKSEVDLDEEVKRWTQVAATPSLFPLLFESGAFDILTSLLSHANTDLAIDAVEVFSELTEADSVMEAPDPQAVISQLVGGHLPDIVIDLLCRLKEEGSEDDALGISSCLSVVENLLELQPSLATTLAQAQKLPAFLLKRIRPPPAAGAAAAGAPQAAAAGVSAFVADGARLHAAEVLAALLQQLQPPEKSQLGARTGADGVDRLLRAVAPYRKKDPESAQEEELVLNLFDSLCSLLLVESNRELLGKQQGVELMLRIVKERRFFTPQAVKALDFALMDSPANCTTFVERLGLRSLFSLFLGKSKDGGYKPKKPEDIIEHVVSIINSLLRNCTGTPIARVLNKFQECGFEKIERLLELRETYAARVRKANIGGKAEVTEEMQEIDKEMGVDTEERLYLDACEAGLSILQQLDCIIMRLTTAGNAMVRMRLMDLMRMKNIDHQAVEKIVKGMCMGAFPCKLSTCLLSEFAEHMDEEAETQKRDLLTLSKYFDEAWTTQEEEEEEEDAE
ncbi:hypothetical protein Efla_003895 [Eimeria flavescens]